MRAAINARSVNVTLLDGDTAGMEAGDAVGGEGIPVGAVIVRVTGPDAFVMSEGALASGEPDIRVAVKSAPVAEQGPEPAKRPAKKTRRKA